MEKAQNPSTMDKESEDSTQEDNLLNVEEEDIQGGNENVNDALFALLQTMNKNMESMNESLKTLKSNGETQTPPPPKTENENLCQQGMTLIQENRMRMQMRFWLAKKTKRSPAPRAMAPRAEKNDPLLDEITQWSESIGETC